MSNSGINSIYLFIAQKPNWQQEMDINGDGKIIQAECRYYIKENAGMVNLEDGANLNDIINKFWKSINSNTKGTSVASLDENEIDKLNQRLEYYENFEEFFKTVLAEFGGSDYNEIVGDYRAKWVESVRTSLLNSLEGFISKGGKPEDVAKFLNGELDDNYYDDPTRKNLKKLAMNMTTANAFARIYLDQNEATKGHEFGDLEKQIDYYIQTLGDNLSVSEIKTAVKKIVDDYVATSLPSWKCPEEEKYLPLNEIQAYTLSNALNQKVQKEIETLEDYETYKDLYDEAVKAYTEKIIKDATRGEYVNLLNKIASMSAEDIINSPEFEEIKNTIEKNKIEKFRTEVINYCKTQSARGEEYAKAVQEVFGEDYASMINTLEYEELGSKYAELQEKIKAVEEAEAKKAKVAELLGNVPEILKHIKDNNLSEIVNGNADLHTEFGVDADGNIVFENSATTTVYNILCNKVLSELKKSEFGQELIDSLGGESIVKKLVQSAWILAYNTYPSSQRNNTAAFIQTVLDNLSNVFKKVKDNQEYIDILTMHTNYADRTLTDGLIHYGTDTTYGNDPKITYEGNTTVGSDGLVHISNNTDDVDWTSTMSQLREKLINKYDGIIDSEKIKEIFKNAQQEALKIAQNNVADCPYATGRGSGSMEANDGNKRFTDGKNNRSGDDFVITMKEIVQLVLYCFDKLLYAELLK